MVCTKILNGVFTAAVSGAKTKVFICLSTGTLISSVVDVNLTSIVSDIPFCVLLITSTVYVPYGNVIEESGHVNRT